MYVIWFDMCVLCAMVVLAVCVCVRMDADYVPGSEQRMIGTENLSNVAEACEFVDSSEELHGTQREV